MGLLWSRDTIDGWRGQFERLTRWYRRIDAHSRARLPEVPEEHFDDVIAFFQCCYSLRDWLIAADPALRKQIDDAAGRSDSMKICRDICNRTKHFTISNPSVDAFWSIGREYVPLNWPSSDRRPGLTETWFVIAGSQKLDLFETADKCFEFWRDFVAINALPNNSQL